MCETIKRFGRHGKASRAIFCFTTRSGSIRHWTTDHQRRSTTHEGELLNGLKAKRTNEAA